MSCEKHGYTNNTLCPACDAELVAAQVMSEKVEPYRVGNTYRTQAGDLVTLVEVANEGTHYETMACADGVHRYTRRGPYGRVTGTPDYSDPRNIPPIYSESHVRALEEQCRGLAEALEKAKRWHEGDKWRNSSDDSERGAWVRFHAEMEQALDHYRSGSHE